MALGKARSNKRSSNSSHSATVTTIVIVSMCIIGLWLLSPSSVTAPKFAARTATVDSTSSSGSQVVNNKVPVFEEGEENLPNDDFKPDDHMDASTENGVTNVEKDEEKESKSEEEQKVEQEGSEGTQNQYHGKENEEQEVQDSEGMTSKDQIEHDQIAHDEDGPIEDDKESEVHHESMEIQEHTQQKSHEETSNDQIQEQRQQSRQESDKESEGHHEKVKTQEQTQQKIDGETNKDHIQEQRKQSKQEFNKESEGHHDKVKIQEQAQQKTQGTISKDQIQHDEPHVHANKDKENNQKEEDDDILHKHHRSGPKEKIPIPTTKIPSPPEGSLGMPPKFSDEQKERHDVVRKEQTNSKNEHKWKLCNVTAGPDYIPCLDNEEAIAKLKSRSHYEHRERHCPKESPTCLVPLPKGYRKPVKWPQSRDKIWYANVPSTELAKVKGHQNWMKVTGEFITFPGGGTQFIHGATHYIEFLQGAVPDISWGKHTRVILDVGCGVASFGAYLFKKDVLAMSFAPKDEHEAQVQFALERGIPAISAVMGTQRLPFPSKVFDLVHCARCRVPWHAGGGILLLEVDRVLRPGGFFVWSETPVYQKNKEDVEIWEEMSNLTMSMCWELITTQKDKLNSIGAAIYQKPSTNECYDKRKRNHPPMCKSEDDPDAAWYIPLQACIHRVPSAANERGTEWPEEWPDRLQTPPQWLNRSQKGFYGKPAREDFVADYENWKQVVNNFYRAEMGIDWSDIRNIMDMRAVYGGFAAALKDLEVWVMNVVNIDSPDTLPIIYERGLFGIHHDWCESFSTYPRTYDLLHADHLFSELKKRCSIVPVLAEVDRIVRPGGNLIVRDDSKTIGEVEILLKSLHWGVNLTSSRNDETILHAHKLNWRPDSYDASS